MCNTCHQGGELEHTHTHTLNKRKELELHTHTHLPLLTCCFSAESVPSTRYGVNGDRAVCCGDDLPASSSSSWRTWSATRLSMAQLSTSAKWTMSASMRRRTWRSMPCVCGGGCAGGVVREATLAMESACRAHIVVIGGACAGSAGSEGMCVCVCACVWCVHGAASSYCVPERRGAHDPWR